MRIIRKNKNHLVLTRQIFCNQKEVLNFRKNFQSFLRAIGNFIANGAMDLMDLNSKQLPALNKEDSLFLIGLMLTEKQREIFYFSVHTILLNSVNKDVFILYDYTIRKDIDCMIKIVHKCLYRYNNYILPSSIQKANMVNVEDEYFISNTTIKRRKKTKNSNPL